MENSLSIALARQSVLGRQMDSIATNLANMNTGGYKAEHTIFSEFLEKTNDGERLSLVHDVAPLRDMSDGPMTVTNNPLDLAISGDGFFVVQTADGPRYTRHGAFQLDNQGQIVTLQGDPVLNSGNSPMVVPTGTSTIEIARDGTLSADALAIGKIQVARFDNPGALKKQGDNLYDAKGQTPARAPDAKVLQGSIEASNVKGVVEMTRMIDVVRSYQSAGKLAESEHRRILDTIDALVGTN